jgi:hypothetical protein
MMMALALPIWLAMLAGSFFKDNFQFGSSVHRPTITFRSSQVNSFDKMG